MKHKPQLTNIVALAVMLACSTMAGAAENERSTFGLSLPQVNDSAIGYGKSIDGAISDKLFYTLGGGSVISQPATRSSMKKLGVDIGWSSNLMCGNFDLKTTVSNQLNGVTDGFKNLMGDVIQGATGAVVSLPAMVIQRANPGLYDTLTNGVLQANVAFDKAQLNCQNMAKRMMEFSDSSKWTQAAVMEEYKSLVNSGEADAIRVDHQAQNFKGNSGRSWIGGQKRGGAGQPAIRPTHDLTAAGFNMMNNLPVTSTSTVGSTSCTGSVCSKFSNAEEAAQAVVKVLGDRTMRTCSKANECTSGGEEQQSGAIAGTGFTPMLEEAVKVNTEQLVKLVNGTEKPTAANLAMADTVETALLMRRMIVTGMSEPNAMLQDDALAEGERRIEALDREIAALKNEMELKRELARNSVLTIIERENQRVGVNPQTESADNTDTRINQLEQGRNEDE